MNIVCGPYEVVHLPVE
jgi:aminopeptidase N